MTGLALRFVFLNRPYCFEVNVNLVILGGGPHGTSVHVPASLWLCELVDSCQTVVP